MLAGNAAEDTTLLSERPNVEGSKRNPDPPILESLVTLQQRLVAATMMTAAAAASIALRAAGFSVPEEMTGSMAMGAWRRSRGLGFTNRPPWLFRSGK